MIRRDTPLVPLEEFRVLEKFLRQMFSQKRKQIGGVLKSYYLPAKLKESFETLKIPLTLRAEALTFEQTLDLYRILRS
jgi:16S rRNA A1518/A1519 N6-dimethyltransferase RsmA/KsgA/DIM1 with predicted DNA glycosylase/AP lyase activity